MDAIFTLPYSEYAAANMLAAAFTPSKGYSVFIPASRSEKGVDLILAKRGTNKTEVLSFQVKASRTYSKRPPIRETKDRRFAHTTWFKRFEIPKQADYFILFGLYPPEQSASKRVSKSWWKSMCLVFSNDEMTRLMGSIKTKGGKPESSFYFEFDNANEVFLTRGSVGGPRDYSHCLFSRKIKAIREAIE